MGRPKKLSKSVIDQILTGIRDGAFSHVAAAAAGIAPSTFYLWMQKGRDGEPEYLEFMEQVEQARALSRADAETRVFNSDPKTWLRLGPGRTGIDGPGWTEISDAPINPMDALDKLAPDEFVAVVSERFQALVRQGEAHALMDEEVELSIWLDLRKRGLEIQELTEMMTSESPKLTVRGDGTIEIGSLRIPDGQAVTKSELKKELMS